jgi:hypothetical protein
MLKHALYFFLKLLILYIVISVFVVDIALIQVSMPRAVFITEPFIHVSLVVIVLGMLVSLKTRSRTPILWTIFWVMFAVALMQTWWQHLGLAFICALFAGAINYLYRNRFTEPTLVFLPILAGALFLIQPVYLHYLSVWAAFETGIGVFKDTTVPQIMIKVGVETLIVLPLIVMHFLGKHGHTKLVPLFQRWRRGKTESDSESS